MLIETEIASLNRPEPGTYVATLEVFGSRHAEFRALMYRYTRQGEATPCAYDLVVRAAGGPLFVRDFQRRPDGWWRDSDGHVAPTVAALLPAEVRSLGLERIIDLDLIEVAV